MPLCLPPLHIELYISRLRKIFPTTGCQACTTKRRMVAFIPSHKWEVWPSTIFNVEEIARNLWSHFPQDFAWWLVTQGYALTTQGKYDYFASILYGHKMPQLLKSFITSSSLAQRAINFVCLNFNTGGGSTTPNLPNTNCPDGVRGQVFLPSCWDGVNLDSANHKSHVAYPSNVDSGTCPPTHPIRFISLFYEIFWRTGEWSNLWWHSDGSQPFILSNGDPTGYGFHGGESSSMSY